MGGSTTGALLAELLTSAVPACQSGTLDSEICRCSSDHSAPPAGEQHPTAVSRVDELPTTFLRTAETPYLMANPLFIHGKLHTPYFIFLRCAGRYSDTDLLQHFGLSNYQPAKVVRRNGRHVILADNGEWVLIADDWYYTLWHRPSTREAIAALAESSDVFACSVGDCDHSFEFAYYRNAHLVRRYIVEDPDFQGGRVVENVGEPLPGEAAAFKQSDELKIVLGVAASLGIKTDYKEQDLRIYAPPPLNGR